jgi:hypothetical protein
VKTTKISNPGFFLPALLIAALPLTSAAARKYSWFDNSPTAEGGVPSLMSSRPEFGLDLYLSRDAARTGTGDAPGVGATGPENTVRLYGDLGPGGASRDPETTQRPGLLGLRWQHRLNADHALAVSAEYGETQLANTASTATPYQDAQDSRAVLSWTSRLKWDWRPSITGSVFLGDESAHDETYRYLGRRYYGLAVGGQMILPQAHTPYVSFRLQRSQYGLYDDPPYAASRFEDQSWLSAGWKWQVQRNLSLQAEASYGLSGPNLDPLFPERSRVFFGTRFDFR